MNMTNEANGEFRLFLSTKNDEIKEGSVLGGGALNAKAATRFAPQQKKKKTRMKKNASIKFSANNFVTQRYDSFNKHYEILELLGEGAYGEVYVCQHRDSGAQRAVKILQFDSEEDAEAVLREFNILRLVDHPNLLKIYQLYEDEETGRFYIVSDLYEGGELYSEIEKYGFFPEEDAAIILNQVLRCIHYIHSHGVMHRDLKPENILLADSNMHLEDIKIIDFGLAEVFGDYEQDRFTDRVGSSYYIAPEVIRGEHGPKVDIWACGVILFILLCGEAPFDGDTDEEIIDAIDEYDGELNFEDNEQWDDVSEEAKDFVQWLLTYEENERPTAEEALKHPWLENARRTSALGLQKRASKEGNRYLSNLEHFRADSKLKQAVCAFVSSQLIMKHEKDVMDELFRAMDTSCNGKLGKDELKAGFADFLGRNLSEEEVDDIFERVNYSCSGAIEYSEFIVASITLDESRLQATFNEFGGSDSGVLTASDLKNVLDLGDHEDADAYVDKILKQIDTDHDDFISFEEFKSAMISDPTSACRRGVERSHSRNAIRRSAKISFDTLEVSTTKDPKLSNVKNVVMDGLLKAWHAAAKKKAPRKIRSTDHCAHAISAGYARSPSTVPSSIGMGR